MIKKGSCQKIYILFFETVYICKRGIFGILSIWCFILYIYYVTVVGIHVLYLYIRIIDIQDKFVLLLLLDCVSLYLQYTLC